MTFDRIAREGRTYINNNGIVFTPLPRMGKIKVSYHIDGNTNVELVHTVPILTSRLKTPDKVDYLMLSYFPRSWVG